MTISIFRKTVLLFFAVAFLTWLNPNGRLGARQNALPTVVQMNKTPQGIAYKVDSTLISDTPTTNLLYILSRVNDKHGSSTPVVLLIDPRIPITEIWNFDGVAGKAQLTNIHHFVINRETEKMSEVKWGPVLPLSANPPLN